MAANVFRLRRSLALVSSTLNHTRNISSVAAPPFSTTIKHQNPNPSLFDITQLKPSNCTVLFKFVSSRSFSSRARYNSNDDMDGDQISPDAILFEGCDYNHWLITMDFPKDNKPSPEEMVETYVQTAAKVLGSVEEAKKKIYACSTTTYNGFQVEVSEEVSEQFKAIPGVVFVLPDSYIDPVNKEYGGDKYINGTIIPRPPPVQYGRQGGRYNDRNRDYNRPPPRGQMGQNNPPPGGQGSYQGDRRGPMPSYQANYNQGRQADFPQRDQGNFTPSEQNSQGGGSGSFGQGAGGQFGQGRGGQYGQGGGGNYGQGSGGQCGQYGQTGGGNYGQGAGGQYGQGGGGNYGQGAGGQYGQGGGGNYGQGSGGQYGQGGGRTYGQGTGGQYGQGGGGSYGQGAGAQYGQGGGGGSYGQGSGGQYGQVSGGNYGQRPGGQYGQGSGGNYGHGTGGQYGQGSGGNYGHGTGGQYGENQRLSQVDQNSNIGGQQRNHEVTEEADAFKER